MPHLSQTELQLRLKNASQQVAVGTRYVHYKTPDQEYTVTELVIIEADDSVGVVYRSEYGANITYMRALSSWIELLEHNGDHVPRFAKLAKR